MTSAISADACVSGRILNLLLDHLRERDGPLLRNVADDQMTASVPRPPGEQQIAALIGRRVRRAVGEDAKQDRSAQGVDISKDAHRGASL